MIVKDVLRMCFFCVFGEVALYGGINEMYINKLWISVVNLLFISLLFVFVQ